MTRKAKRNYKQRTCFRYVGDGLPLVDVYLNGERLKGVVRANSKRGYAVVAEEPLRQCDGKVSTIKLRGRVQFKRIKNDG